MKVDKFKVLTSCLIECTLLLLSFELLFVLLSVLVKLGSNDKTQTDEASEMNSHRQTDLPVVREHHYHHADNHERTLRYLV